MTKEQLVKTPLTLAFSYTYIKLLGEGANGKTWLGRSKIDGQLVAIKELKTSVMEDMKALELFKREAETLESITVPGVPKFYGSIFDDREEQACYLIQEYIPYPSIADLLKEEGKFSEEETLTILEKLANILLILQTQYSPPIIHRDIKPSNLLCKIEEDMDRIQLFLIDFGAVANPQKRTGGSTIAGTFGYMAPEQLQGECSIQSDFYAMGATAIHMLTNVSPYTLPSDVFKLNYKPTLQYEAPQTSKYMIELIDYLLEAKASERPKTANDLLSAIKYVKHQKSPHTDDAKKEAFQTGYRIPKLYSLMNRTDVKDPTHPQDSWIKASGIARGFTTLENVLCIEFTYKYQDHVFVAIDSHPFLAGANMNMRFPMSCGIIINPDDPHISYITSINGCKCLDEPPTI